jgi:beta-lactam-binding protein with PASTA domain
MQWPLLISVVGIVAITAVYFIWLRKPAATATKQEEQPQQQPQS